MKTLERLRAGNALTCVKDLNDKIDNRKKLYSAYVDRLGPAIVMNGLGQALASERAAAGDEPKLDRELAHKELFDNVQNWLCRKDGGVYPPSDDLLQAIIEGDEALYLRAQSEALAWLNWHRKFCHALLPKGDGGMD